MKAFRDFSITNKIRIIVMIVSSITLLMACGILGALEVINFRQTKIHELSILSKIIADRSTASLAFDDPKIAHETLDALKVEGSILSAYIFNDSGEIFASYYRQGSDPDSLPVDLESEGTWFNATSLHVISPVLLEKEKIGTVFIKSDLDEMYALIWKYIGYVALVLFFAILTAFFMLTKLQQFISRPILDLANAAGLTAINMDYSTRVTKKGNDEIGLLVDAFNAMMDQIKQRDMELIESRNRAESSAGKARDLAKETEQINLKLQKEIAERKRIYNALRNSEKKLKEAYKQLEKRVEERTSELRETNTELRKAIQAADEAANAKSEFLANMSHEIRTPMNGVINAAELALSEEIPLKVEHYLKIIYSSGNALLGVINDILDFSKIDSGDLVLDNQNFRLDTILQNAITIFSSVTAEKDIELLLDISANTPMDIIGDPLKYQQILTNLLSNAVKFTGKDGMILIEISSENIRPDAIRLTCSVQDTGIGMRKDQRDLLFQAFTQGDTSTTRKFGGTGLGLCISQQIAELMHGQIFMESEFGKGSKFTFTTVMELPPNQTPSPLLLPENLKGLNILIVDDCAENRKILSSLIETFGFYADFVASGMSAINLLKEYQQQDTIIDLAIIDMKMPGMDGLETAMEIRGDLYLKFPIILMTSALTDFTLPGADNSVIDGFIAKPVTASSLLNSIMDVFGGKSIRKSMPESDAVARHREYKKLLSGLKILVAEDNRVNQEIAVEILKSVGITAQIASDGAEAVRAVSKETFDAVLMDIQMPNMDGYEATRKIRKKKDLQALPIIAMTASTVIQDEKRCIEAGMNGFVPKPVRPEKLFRTLLKHVHPELELKLSEMDSKENALFIIEKPVASGSNFKDNTLPELNIRQAARNLNLEIEVYKKILSRFFNNNIHTLDRLRTAASQHQWKHLQSLAHSLKGSSGNIGADRVKEVTGKIEQFCSELESEPIDKTKINLLLNDFEKHFAQLLSSIKTVINVQNKIHEDESPSEKDLSQARPVLTKLIDALKAADPIAINECLDRVKQHKTGFSLQSIEYKINEYEYDDAIEALIQHTSQWT
ncbi:MAG: response regulator [Desulfobacteraceae bacterium]|nr:response regulator [Desulfobacteraceae bacterium]MBC2757489.1 response regulator [Desulfobacteraceae bacterium]